MPDATQVPEEELFYKFIKLPCVLRKDEEGRPMTRVVTVPNEKYDPDELCVECHQEYRMHTHITYDTHMAMDFSKVWCTHFRPHKGWQAMLAAKNALQATVFEGPTGPVTP